MNILYTTHCPKCTILQQKLDSKKIKYQICEDTDEMMELGMTTAPAFYTEETGLMDFGAAVKWLQEA